MIDKIKSWFQPKETKVITVVILREDQIRLIEKQFAFDVQNDTSQIRAGYQCGVNAVIRKLREGFSEESIGRR